MYLHKIKPKLYKVDGSDLTGLDRVVGLATPTGLTGGSDRSTWNPSRIRILVDLDP